MKLLALDTSSNACSVAATDGEVVVESHVVEPREHTRLLVPMINRLLDELAVSLADLDAIVLGNGPGSFIGMRIGASVAQGLAFGSGVKIVQVSSLAAVATEVMMSEQAERVVVAQDARMNQVYAGEFFCDEEDLPAIDGEERIVASNFSFDSAAPFVAAGQGWQRYPDLLDGNRDALTRVSAVGLPRARFLLPGGRVAWAGGKAVDPADIVPAYLRSKVAEKPSA